MYPKVDWDNNSNSTTKIKNFEFKLARYNGKHQFWPLPSAVYCLLFTKFLLWRKIRE